MDEEYKQIALSLMAKMDRLIDVLTSGATIVGVPSPVLVSDCKYTLYSWLDEWYNTYKLPKLKASGAYQIHNCIEKHIKPHLPDMPLNQYTAMDIQNALNTIDGTRMKKYTFDTLNAALKQAVKNDIILVNPMSKLETVKHTRQKRLSLTKEQEIEFIDRKSVV